MKRVLTAIGLLILALYLIFFAPHWGFLAAALITGILCYREYDALVAAHGIPRPGILGALIGVYVLFAPWFVSPAVDTLLGLTLALLLVCILALRFTSLKDILPHAGSVIFGALYTFAPWRFAVDLRSASVHLLFFALALNWAGDTTAYYVGRAFGKHPLAPVVSPKKSWEGALASVAGSILFGALYLGHFVQPFAVWKIVTMAVLGNVAGQFGDLAESAIKRGAGVKDSGNLLPGHGGILDRLDSSLFALPVVLLVYGLVK